MRNTITRQFNDVVQQIRKLISQQPLTTGLLPLDTITWLKNSTYSFPQEKLVKLITIFREKYPTIDWKILGPDEIHETRPLILEILKPLKDKMIGYTPKSNFKQTFAKGWCMVCEEDYESPYVVYPTSFSLEACIM